MINLFGKKGNEPHNFWMSYTDLLSGFLVLFIIASIVYYEKNKSYIDDGRRLHEERGNMVNVSDVFKDVVDSVNCSKLDSLVIDTLAGSIRIYANTTQNQSAMLFQTESDTIEPNLRNTLKQFGPKFVYKAIALVRDSMDVQEIRIEGHADSSGDFLHNLGLSSRRAIYVYQFIYDSCGLTKEQKTFMKEYIVPVGYSSSIPIKDKEGSENMKKSRRIEFKIIGKNNYTRQSQNLP